MKATGEVMAIDRSFEGAFQKAVRSLEVGGRTLLWEDPEWSRGGVFESKEHLREATDFRLWAVMAALRRGMSGDEITKLSGIDPWFVHAFARIVGMERRLLAEDLGPGQLWEAKRLGFSDEQIGVLADLLPPRVRELRRQWGIRPVYKMIDTCAAEFEAVTSYFYGTYEQENEAAPLEGAKAVVVGSGPIRIGQGIEFDYCSVHAAWALQEVGVQGIMVNSNPETVSTDFDTSSRLYFEPLDGESLQDIIENETAEEGPPPSVVQFGGQTAIDLSQVLDQAALPILGFERGRYRHRFRPASVRRVSGPVGNSAAARSGGDDGGERAAGGAEHRVSRSGASGATCSAGGRWRSCGTRGSLSGI